MMNLAKPWITRGLRTSIAVKNHLYKSYIRTRSDYYFTKFKFYRNKLNHLLDISKKNYYQNFFSENSKNIKGTWKGIRQLVTLKQNNTVLPNTINVNNSKVSNLKNNADLFNKYFATIGADLANKIPTVNNSIADYLQQSNSYSHNSFFLFPTTKFEIENEIDKLNDNKATGPFSIPTKLLKIIKLLISEPLDYIFNISFATGIVPDKLKMAGVIPIYKKGLRTEISNYRPISLLSIFNKILESIVYNRLVSYFNKHDILYKNQFGFRSNHSTTQAILKMTDKIQKAIENKEYSCGIFLDLSKAFDTVNHQILIQKLDHYGIRSVPRDWFCSYLSDRKKFVSIGDTTSDLYTLGTGVSQGSVLGPLLFPVYINDFGNSSESLEFHLFADDSNLFFSHKSLQALERSLNKSLDEVNKWLCVNKLSLNIEKSNFVIFHPIQRKIHYSVNLSIAQKQIEEVRNLKYLWVIIDSTLNWKDHVHQVSKKIAISIGILSKLRHYVDVRILTNLYYSIVYPFLTYAVIIWGNTYASTIKPLVTLQKKAIRIINFTNFQAHTNHLFFYHKILKFHDIVTFSTALFMYDYYHGKYQSSFMICFQW